MALDGAGSCHFFNERGDCGRPGWRTPSEVNVLRNSFCYQSLMTPLPTSFNSSRSRSSLLGALLLPNWRTAVAISSVVGWEMGIPVYSFRYRELLLVQRLEEIHDPLPTLSVESGMSSSSVVLRSGDWGVTTIGRIRETVIHLKCSTNDSISSFCWWVVQSW